MSFFCVALCSLQINVKYPYEANLYKYTGSFYYKKKTMVKLNKMFLSEKCAYTGTYLYLYGYLPHVYRLPIIIELAL